MPTPSWNISIKYYFQYFGTSAIPGTTIQKRRCEWYHSSVFWNRYSRVSYLSYIANINIYAVRTNEIFICRLWTDFINKLKTFIQIFSTIWQVDISSTTSKLQKTDQHWWTCQNMYAFDGSFWPWLNLDWKSWSLKFCFSSLN